MLRRWVRPSAARAPTPTSSPPTAPTEQPPADASEVPALPGLDTALGLRRVLGNRSLYLKLLRQFPGNQDRVPERFTEAMVAADRVLAERIVHNLRGVAGGIGATSVQQRAEALETAVRTTQPRATIDALLQALQSELDPLPGGLRAWAGEPASKTSG